MVKAVAEVGCFFAAEGQIVLSSAHGVRAQLLKKNELRRAAFPKVFCDYYYV